jgi:hypothetical protein
MICGSLRKGSFNRALMNALPALAPDDMKLTEAPSFRGFPLYDADRWPAHAISLASSDDLSQRILIRNAGNLRRLSGHQIRRKGTGTQG